jgi:hypothetical protein
LPVRARRAKARERLPSYRDLASRNPQTEPALTCLRVIAFRAPVRRLSARAPRQAVLPCFPLASAPIFNKSCDFPNKGPRDASDRLLPPERFYVYPYLVCSQLAPRLSSRGHPTESWAPYGLPGDRVFHDTRERFGGSMLGTRCQCCLGLLAVPLPVRELRAWALSSHGAS